MVAIERVRRGTAQRRVPPPPSAQEATHGPAERLWRGADGEMPPLCALLQSSVLQQRSEGSAAVRLTRALVGQQVKNRMLGQPDPPRGRGTYLFLFCFFFLRDPVMQH